MRRSAILLATWLACTRPCLAAIDVNTASADELQSIRGIGPVIAAKIVEARLRGPFVDAEDLQGRVKGFGEKTVRRLAAAGLAVPSGRIRKPEPTGPEVIVGRPVIESVAALPKTCPRSCPGPAPVGATSLWAPAPPESPPGGRSRPIRLRRAT